MVPNALLQALAGTCLFGGMSLAMPSSNDVALDLRAILPMNGMLTPRSEPLEVRGVYGGKKKRYIIETRAPTTCCSKQTCKSEVGEILNDQCKCQKCASGKFPSTDGRTCVDKCPDGGKPNNTGGCCKGDKCPKDDDKDFKRGKCPEGQILDLREGGQDENTEKPKCAIDDRSKCKAGTVPKTRWDGDELSKDYEPECGKMDDKDRQAECLKGRFRRIYTYYNDGDINDIRAGVECEKTRQFDKKKVEKSKSKEFKNRQKDDWNRRKPQRDEQEKERQKWKDDKEKREKEWEEIRKKMDKLTEEQDRKKARMGKCAPVAALMYAVAESGSNAKRDESESPYDWTTDYFDEDFVQSPGFLDYWPEDVNIDDCKEVTKEGVDANAWMSAWEDIVSRRQWESGPHQCGSKKRDEDGLEGVEKRCIARRFEQEMDFGDVHVYQGNDTVIERYVEAEEEIYRGSKELMIRDPSYIVPRNPVAIIAQIIFFALRLGASLLARTASAIARYSPRLASLAKNTDRLFKVAPKGQGTPRGVDGMRNAMSNIIKNKNFRKCLLDGAP